MKRQEYEKICHAAFWGEERMIENNALHETGRVFNCKDDTFNVKVGDAVYALSTDSTVYRITGAGRSWRADPVAFGYLPLGALAAVSYGDAAYFWANAGFCRLSDAGLSVVSAGKLDVELKDQQIALTGAPWTWEASAGFDHFHREAWLWDGANAWVYAERSDDFSEYTVITHDTDIAYSAALQVMMYALRVPEDLQVGSVLR